MGVDKFYRNFLLPKQDLTYMGNPTATNGYSKVVALTPAQINGMHATPVSILPAPDTSHAIIVAEIAVEAVLTSTPFAGGGALNFQYHTTTSSVPHAGTIPASFLTDSTPGTYIYQLGPNVGTNGLVIPTDAEGIDLTNAGAAFTTGTGCAVYVYIWWRSLHIS